MLNREAIVVAIRTLSAGARACGALLRGLPSRSGLALVLIAEPSLRATLEASLRTPLVPIKDSTPLSAGRVHWIAAGAQFRLEQQVFREDRRRRGSDDGCNGLLLSMAQQHRERTAAVVLPGSNPGPLVRGLNAVRAAGGLTFGWPQALGPSRGVLDFALPPEEIAVALTRLAAEPREEPGSAQQHAFEPPATAAWPMFQGAPQAIIAVDRHGNIIAGNPEAEKIFGREEGELASQPFEILLPPERRTEYRSAWRACFSSLKTGAKRNTLEIKACRKNGTPFTVEIRVGRVETRSGPVAVAFVTDISERKRAEDEIRRSHHQLRLLNARLISVQEETRKAFARELHDVLAQQVAVVATQINKAEQGAARFATEVNTTVAQASRELRRLSANVHDFARRLHPSILYELGLLAALKSECLSFERQYGIRTSFVSGSGVPKRLSDQTGLALYRIAQEAMRNAVQHAKARRIRLAVRARHGEVIMIVADNGRGFDVERARRKGGLGLISMEERARLVNAALVVRSRPDRGTSVEVRIATPRK